MNKIGISLLSALATLGVVGGAGAIALSTPALKEKLNISFADNVIFGKGNKQENQPDLKPVEPEQEESFSQGLANRNLVMVNYQINDETIIRIQEKDSSVELLEVPKVYGCTFIGWTDNLETRELVGQVKDGMTLYPIYISNENHIIFEYYGLDEEFTNHVNTANQYFGNKVCSYVSATGSFNAYLLGFTENADSKEMLTTLSNSKTYYPVVFVAESKKVCSYNEFKEEYSIYQCGLSAMNNVILHTFDSVETTKAYKTSNYINTELDVDTIKFTLIGFSLSPDSKTIVSKQSMVDGGSYYAVYEAKSNYVEWSLNELKNGWDIVIHTSGVSQQIQCKHYEDLATFTHRYGTNGVVFNFKGFALAEDSTEIIDTALITEEYCKENEIRHLYCVYERSDTLEIYSSSELYTLLRYRKATYVHYILDGVSTTVNHVYLLDVYEKDIVVDDVTYTFYGWSTTAGDTEILEVIGNNNYHLYAVYQNVETAEILPMSMIV